MSHSGNPPPPETSTDDYDQTAGRTKHALFSPASVELLRSCVNDSLTRNRVKEPLTHPTSSASKHELSLPDIIRTASLRFINPSDCDATSEQVELVHHLLTAAEEMGRKNYEQAIYTLNICDSLSSNTGNLTQRFTYYLARSLRQIIHDKSGVHITSLVEEMEKLNIEEAITAPSPIVAAIYSKIPFYQVGQLAGVQAILDCVEKSRRIHIIDLRIRNGMQWTALMQALSSRSKRELEILKITAIVDSTSETLIHETGERLAKFAKSMNIPFAFRAIVVPNMLALDKKQFDLDHRDAVAIFSEYALQGLLPKPSELEAFMTVIRNIRPMLMVVIETEANFNSLEFAHRFVELIFHYGAYFDCVDTCFDTSDGNRMFLESMFLSEQVNDVIVKEETEMSRTVRIEVWRKFFSQYWMVESSLSSTTMETVNMVMGRFSNGDCCNVDMEGRSLVVGWKGTPMFSLSTWKFLLAKPLIQTYKKKKKKIDSSFWDGVPEISSYDD